MYTIIMIFSFGHVFVCFVCPIIVSCIKYYNKKNRFIHNNNNLKRNVNNVTIYIIWGENCPTVKML